jgi:hypothetical protein
MGALPRMRCCISTRTFNAFKKSETVISELYRFFRPELIGRRDEKVVFKPFFARSPARNRTNCLGRGTGTPT